MAEQHTDGDLGAQRRYLKMPAELGDGEHVSIQEATTEGLGDLAGVLAAWLEEADEGETIEIGWESMSVREFEKLPTI